MALSEKQKQSLAILIPAHARLDLGEVADAALVVEH